MIGQRAATGGAARHRRVFGFSNPTGGKEREALTDPRKEVGDRLARADAAPPGGMEAGLEALRTETFYLFIYPGSPNELLLWVGELSSFILLLCKRNGLLAVRCAPSNIFFVCFKFMRQSLTTALSGLEQLTDIRLPLPSVLGLKEGAFFFFFFSKGLGAGARQQWGL